MNKCYFFLSFLLLAVSAKAFAHSSQIKYRETTAITIQAEYDDGKPMKNAQVAIYAPSDRTNPWLKGTTDESGNFTFFPDTDPKNMGDWDVKVRQSGHGKITSIPVEDGKLADNAAQNYQTNLSSVNSISYTPSQKMVMAAAGVWGFVGTALFFSRSKSSN